MRECHLDRPIKLQPLRLSGAIADIPLSLPTPRHPPVSELNLPHDRKTIKPDKRLGGVAGGLKYIVQNILFKFALDTPRPQRAPPLPLRACHHRPIYPHPPHHCA